MASFDLYQTLHAYDVALIKLMQTVCNGAIPKIRANVFHMIEIHVHIKISTVKLELFRCLTQYHDEDQ